IVQQIAQQGVRRRRTDGGLAETSPLVEVTISLLKPALKVECSAGLLRTGGLGLACEEYASMNRAIAWSIAGGVLLAAAAALVVAAPERKSNPAFDFIAGNRPVTEDQVRDRL